MIRDFTVRKDLRGKLCIFSKLTKSPVPLIGKDLDAGKNGRQKKRVTEDEMVR